MNWLGAASLVLLLFVLLSPWWWMEGYLPNLGGYFKYEGNPITFIWSSGNRSSLSFALKTFSWLSDEGRLPPGSKYRSGLTRFFLILSTLMLVLGGLLAIYALARESTNPYFWAAFLVFLALAFYELGFMVTEAPRSLSLTLATGDEQTWVKWGEGIGKYLDVALAILLIAAGIVNKIYFEYEPGPPKRPPRRRKAGRYWW
ncbi:MAG: hypothetical protein J7L91_00765 [Candidatus Korarchaeota archaeon]|nr:hypothetical protein [Candidatus Korarchaeota archaeon]